MTTTWQEICEAAAQDAMSLSAQFKSSYSAYEKYDGECQIVGITIDCESHDEEALPWIKLLNPATGDSFEGDTSEVSRVGNPKVERLLAVLNGVYSAARESGQHVGPQALMTDGTEAEKTAFLAVLAKL